MSNISFTSDDFGKSLLFFSKLENKDSRIKVYHIENNGPAHARDYGISKASDSSKYIFFIDSDDLIDKTTLEVLYWTLETHKDASFAYTIPDNSMEPIFKKDSNNYIGLFLTYKI